MSGERLVLGGSLSVPPSPVGAALLVHRNRSGRQRDTSVLLADMLHHRGFATLLVELLTPEEAALDAHTAHVVADVERMAGRVAIALEWLRDERRTRGLPVGLLGEGHAAGAVLLATAHRQGEVAAAIARGGQPDAIGDRALGQVRAPTLFVVGEQEEEALDSARAAAQLLEVPAEVAIVSGVGDPAGDLDATHTVCWLVREWFLRHVPAPLEGA